MRSRLLCSFVLYINLCGLVAGQDADEPKRLYNVGLAHLGTGRNREAIDCFQRALRLDPSFVEAWIQLGQTHIRAKDHEKGVTALVKAVETAPARPDARVALAAAYLDMGMNDTARNALEEATPLIPIMDIPTLFSYAMMGRRAGIENTVNKALRSASRLKPSNTHEWFLVGLLYLEAGNTDTAILALENATLTKSPLPDTWYNLGIAHTRTGNHSEAVRMFVRAHKAGVEHRELYVNMGTSLSACNRLGDTVIVFRELTSRYPDYPEGWYNLALACAKHGWIDEAVRHYEKAVELNPDYHEAAKALQNARDYIQRRDADPAARHSLYHMTPDPGRNIER